MDWEGERRKREKYWATVNYARRQLYDYCGISGRFSPAMYSMLGEIKKWTPDQILRETSKTD